MHPQRCISAPRTQSAMPASQRPIAGRLDRAIPAHAEATSSTTSHEIPGAPSDLQDPVRHVLFNTEKRTSISQRRDDFGHGHIVAGRLARTPSNLEAPVCRVLFDTETVTSICQHRADFGHGQIVAGRAARLGEHVGRVVRAAQGLLDELAMVGQHVGAELATGPGQRVQIVQVEMARDGADNPLRC
jgi:hypothetical protein